MKNILICGATGFIGKNILEYYAKQNFKIRAVYFEGVPHKRFKNVEWVRYDLRKKADVRNAVRDMDIIMQFAATTTGSKDIVSRPFIHVTDNVVMNSLLLRESFESGVKHFIFPSCTIMYQNSEAPVREEDYSPSNEMQTFYYGAAHTKVYLENMCKFYSSFGKAKYTVLRHSNIYGPYDKYDLEKSHVTGATIAKVMSSCGEKICVWGSGEEKRDLLYVEDLINFIDLAKRKQKERFQIFNVGSGEGISVKNLVKKVIECSGKDLEIEYDKSKPTIPTSLFLDCTRAANVLGWSPKYTLERGINKTLKWYKENLL